MKVTELKKQYVEYFEDVPVQKYAASFIGRDEDTIIRWKKTDSAFADSIERAKAIWVRKKVLAVKAEFALERLEAGIFKPVAEPVMTQPQYTASVRDERGAYLRDKYTEFMLEVTKQETSQNVIDSLRDVRDYLPIES